MSIYNTSGLGAATDAAKNKVDEEKERRRKELADKEVAIKKEYSAFIAQSQEEIGNKLSNAKSALNRLANENKQDSEEYKTLKQEIENFEKQIEEATRKKISELYKLPSQE